MTTESVVNCRVCKYTTELKRWETVPIYATTDAAAVDVKICPNCGALVDISKQETWYQAPT